MTDNADRHDAVRIERVLDAPVPIVWQLWTDPHQFAAWYGPAGASIPVAQMDVRVGGTRLVCMQITTPSGPMQMWFTGEYREVSVNQRLVYTESMSNENGEIIAPSDLGMPADHPATTEIRVDFEDLGQRTRMVMTHLGVAPDSPGAAGWTMAFDKLASYIASRH